MTKDIGIDLGTTFSVVAVDGRAELATDYPGGAGIYVAECDVTVIPSPIGEATFPSVVMQDPDNPSALLFGSEALQRAEEGFAPVMFSKRKIGTREALLMQSRAVTAHEVARELLRYMKSCAEAALGAQVTRAVVTHPAYFDRGAVEETRQAAVEAGFDMSLPQQMLMEPVAAALSFTRADQRDPLRILTFDMGGGTLDVTYLERRAGVIDMRAFDGDPLLGGYNFDRELVHWIRGQLERRGRRIELDEKSAVDRGRLMRLLRLAERVKIDLANARTDQVPVEVRARDVLVDTEGRPVQINERISREQFVALIQHHIDHAVGCCTRVLEKAKMNADEIHEILLVGGSSYGPWVREALMRAFPGREPRLFNPDLCVGAGAAIHARMVLPPMVSGERYTLSLDVPESCVLDVLNISGQLTSKNGGSPVSALRAVLSSPDSDIGGEASLDERGRFLFEGVELGSGTTRFQLRFLDPKGQAVLAHGFNVAYRPENAQTSAVVTVLPRPLYVETADGLAPLAEEGVSLPARCSRTFRRVNDNPNITLRLFQESDPIGEVRIENIPREGGKGSFVDLEVEVTEKNQIRGTAVIRTTGGAKVAKSQVHVLFDTPVIPTEAELRAEFDDLKATLLARVLTLTSEESRNSQREALAVVANVEHVFEQQPVERQEVFVALRRLRNQLNPPEDQMKPTRATFLSTLAGCRTALQNRIAKAREASSCTESSKDAPGADGKMAANARDVLTKAGRMQGMLDKLESEGLAAHERKDKYAWARCYDALTDLEVGLREGPNLMELPTFIHKMLASHSVDQYMQQLDSKIDDLEQAGNLSDWQGEIERIQRAILSALTSIHAIDDGLPTDQGLAQIRQVFAHTVAPLDQAIKNLGLDVKAR
jgi:molecular chaperone DnaK (HSP70)